jgi:arylsulfatase A-like enzyme
MLQAFHPDRCGDVVFYPREYWIFGGNVATHGTPYDYDRHVPLMFLGAGFTGGRITTRVAPVDIAPTLAKILGVELDDVDGKPLGFTRE